MPRPSKSNQKILTDNKRSAVTGLINQTLDYANHPEVVNELGGEPYSLLLIALTTLASTTRPTRMQILNIADRLDIVSQLLSRPVVASLPFAIRPGVLAQRLANAATSLREK